MGFGIKTRFRKLLTKTGVLPRNRQEAHERRLRSSLRRNLASIRLTRWAQSIRGGRPRLVAINLTEHFGDIVACEPVARYIRERQPDAYIVWCVSSRYKELLALNRHIDRVVEVSCLTEWMKLRDNSLLDEVIDLHPQGRVCQMCQVPLNKSQGDRAVTVENYYNYGTLLQAFCRGAGLPPLENGPRLYMPESAIKAVDALDLPSRFVVVHCSSNEAERDWPVEKWRQLVGELIDSGQTVVEVGLQGIVQSKSPGFTDLCGGLSLLETAEVIRRAELFIGIDSGPAHLANAAETYGVILLGRYRIFDRYCPYSGGYGDGSNAKLIQHDGPVAGVPVEQVLEAVNRRLKGESAELPISVPIVARQPVVV